MGKKEYVHTNFFTGFSGLCLLGMKSEKDFHSNNIVDVHFPSLFSLLRPPSQYQLKFEESVVFYKRDITIISRYKILHTVQNWSWFLKLAMVSPHPHHSSHEVELGHCIDVFIHAILSNCIATSYCRSSHFKIFPEYFPYSLPSVPGLFLF